MATNIDGLGGLNTTSGLEKLIASYGNDLTNVVTGLGYNQNITSGNNAEFEEFLDNLFFENYKDRPRHFDGTTWKKTLATKMPMAKYQRRVGTRLYLAYTKFPQTGVESWDKDPIAAGVSASEITFPSRVFFPELPTQKKELKWGLLWSAKFSTYADGDNKIYLSSIVDIGFKDAGIKYGDPLYILDGNSLSVGKYTISSVDSNTQVTTVEKVPKQLTNSSGWCGSNWFDVNTDDGDFLTGIAENNGQVVLFKQNTIHRYNRNSLVQVKGVPGATASRSIVNIKDTFTAYFHGSQGNRTGVYLFDGVTGKNISRAIEKHIAGISPTMFSSVVGWAEGDLLRMYVGDITNANHNISVSKAVLTYDITTNTWSVDSQPKTIRCATQIRQSGAVNTYIGDTDASIFLTGDETSFSYDGSPINFSVESGPRYPRGVGEFNLFTRAIVIARNGRGIKLEYKMYDTPNSVDDKWYPLGEIKDDLTEFKFPTLHKYGSGIEIRYAQSEVHEPDMLIEKCILYFNPEGKARAEFNK